ncbi:MGMT family protein [Candidatus Curtissbacteria bacterium]|nr:MGMT family protein [Candidatus Curtissbacteria bacterium]
MTRTEGKFSDLVYQLVSQIPKGKVATYGEIVAELRQQEHLRGVGSFHLGGGGARAVGNALHRNRDPKVPCHRVVDRNGRLATHFAFDGAGEQKRRLVAEGVKFKDNMHVDLGECLWDERETDIFITDLFILERGHIIVNIQLNFWLGQFIPLKSLTIQ